MSKRQFHLLLIGAGCFLASNIIMRLLLIFIKGV